MLLQKSIPYLRRCRNISVSIRSHREVPGISHQNVISKRLPLSVPLPMENKKVSTPKGALSIGRNSKLTQLSNGLKVCTENTYGDFVTVGVAVDSGCRFENGFPFGISRVVEKLAYNCSENFRNRDDVYAQLEENSGIVDCQSTRDTMMYAASCHVDGTDSIISVLSDTVLRPIVDESSLEQAKLTVSYENTDLPNRIEAIEILLTDYIHQAAFQHNTIGYPKFGLDSLDKIRVSDVYGFLSRVHTPDRMVVGGIGVDHDEFVSIISRHFESKQPIWNSQPNLLPAKIPQIDESRSQYTGGEVRIQKDLLSLTVGKPYPMLAHVVLGLEGCSYKDEDFVAFCVLQSLLGGGGAFSAGGPGKGMYARMYTELMNRHHYIYSAIAHNHSYSDSGVFTLTASTPPENINDALILLVQQVLQLQHGVEMSELARARTQLRSHLMMNLEVRPVLFEDMVRQVLGHGVRKHPEEYAERIEKVSNVDIVRVAERLLSSKPSLVGYGDLTKLGDYISLDQALAKRDLKYLFKR
ncbi:CRE-MPPA-1 protein [Caenorhabditis remanei]|uniref:Mitochondrial-processing peptidase subunit alpha n=1 Tax=Caenorhabditis remanei TaxID=31234 RepID=E3LXR1_CAERE|nr:CRE-MPPA-1 protein [Caenorhabditis remanei]